MENIGFTEHGDECRFITSAYDVTLTYTGLGRNIKRRSLLQGLPAPAFSTWPWARAGFERDSPALVPSAPRCSFAPARLDHLSPAVERATLRPPSHPPARPPPIADGRTRTDGRASESAVRPSSRPPLPPQTRRFSSRERTRTKRKGIEFEWPLEWMMGDGAGRRRRRR